MSAIYVGGTFSRYLEVRSIIDALKTAGHTVTHDWTRHRRVRPTGTRSPDRPAATTSTLWTVRGTAHDVNAVAAADLLLMLGQEPSCGWPIEIGIGIALEKAVWIVAPFKYTVFWDLENVETFDDVAGPLRRLGAST